MPNLNEIRALTQGSPQEQHAMLLELFHHYQQEVHRLTGRNVISYYSAWLHHPGAPNLYINDLDKNDFMTAVHNMDRSLGLDLLLHTPGGDIAATESLVSYLKSLFKGDIRAIVPQISMSAGTMIAMSCREIIMGKHPPSDLSTRRWAAWPARPSSTSSAEPPARSRRTHRP